MGHFELKWVICKNKANKNKYQLIFYAKYLIISLLSRELLIILTKTISVNLKNRRKILCVDF
jgi:hypothetical protein